VNVTFLPASVFWERSNDLLVSRLRRRVRHQRQLYAPPCPEELATFSLAGSVLAQAFVIAIARCRPRRNPLFISFSTD